jgi:hypothetical protein
MNRLRQRGFFFGICLEAHSAIDPWPSGIKSYPQRYGRCFALPDAQTKKKQPGGCFFDG